MIWSIISPSISGRNREIKINILIIKTVTLEKENLEWQFFSYFLKVAKQNIPL